MSISVIIPNFNGKTILRNCLHSLAEQERHPDQIIVVDNGSRDGSAEMISEDFSKVTLVTLKNNTGFTGANNAGIKQATGSFLVLLNNDCIVEPGWLANLEKRMEDPTVGAVTSSMRNINDTNIMDSAGGKIDWMGFSRDIAKGEAASNYAEAMEIPFPSGGAAIIRRIALPDQSRLFWDELFAYQEDLDLGLELIRTGWKVVYEPTAIVRHMHSATSGNGSFFKEFHCIRNRLLVMRKHFTPETFGELAPVIKKWQNLWLLASISRGHMTAARSILKGTKAGLSLPVKHFKADITAEEVFSRFAERNLTAGSVKQKLYKKAEKIICSNLHSR